MSSSAQTTNAPFAEPWPEGVVVRYPTKGAEISGLPISVDIRHDEFSIYDTEPNITIAQCGGCPANHQEKWAKYAYRTDNGSSGADTEVSKWAQSHAETCRAVPRPTV